MINIIIALLVEVGLLKLDQEQIESFAQKVRQGTLPQDFKSAQKLVHEWLEEAKAGK